MKYGLIALFAVIVTCSTVIFAADVPPVNSTWVEGHWVTVENQQVWIKGYWTTEKVEKPTEKPQVVYVQQPQTQVVYVQQPQPQVVYVQQPQVIYVQQPRSTFMTGMYYGGYYNGSCYNHGHGHVHSSMSFSFSR